MVDSDYCLERVLNQVSDCITENLDSYLQKRLENDALSPADDRLYAGVMPSLVNSHRGDPLSFPNNRQTPAMYIYVDDQIFNMDDASNSYDVESTVTVRIVLASKDLKTTNPTLFQNAMTAYANGVAWCLMSQFKNYGPKAGAYSCVPQRVPYGPALDSPDSNGWIRMADVELLITHRVSQTKI